MPHNCNQRLAHLRSYLRDFPASHRFDDDDASLLHALVESWECFEGHDANGMHADKLDRMESATWEPPELAFIIERHGGMVVGGSSRAELQAWTIDVDAAKAFVWRAGHRQLKPAAPRLNLHPTADAIAELVLSRADDKRLRWNPRTEAVTIQLATFLREVESKTRNRSSNKQTRESRSRRLRRLVAERLFNDGWTYVGRNRFIRAHVG